MDAVPAGSMLWESVDPIDALTERFGCADPRAAVAWMDAIVRTVWRIDVGDCERLVISDRSLLAWIGTDAGPLIVKSSVATGRFRRLADTADLVGWLGARGLPVAAPIPATDGQHRVEIDGVSVGLCRVVAGELLDVDDPAQVADAGRALATFHEAMATYPGSIDGRRPGRHAQLVHNDVRSANILHDGTCITALLDFDDVEFGTRVADLAKAMVLLGTRFHDWRPTDPAVRATFLAAYQEQAPLSGSELDEVQAGVSAVLDQLGW